MNILPFLHFFAFLVYCSLIIFILWKDRKSLLNRVCAAFLACLALWSFGFIFVYNQDISKETTILFDNIASIGWISFASLFFWFALIFTEKKKILKTKIIYPLILILPLLLIYKKWTGFLIDYIKLPWGWGGVWSDSIWTYLLYFYCLSFTVTGLYLIYNFGRKSEEPLKKKQARIIFVTGLLSLIFGTLTDVIVPEFNILRIPSLVDLITLVWAGGLVYAITKYRLMVVTPFTAAENIISTMADALVLLDREGKMVDSNNAMQDLSGYSTNELKGKSIGLFFPENDFHNHLLNRVIKKKAFQNQELNFQTKIAKVVPVLFSSSTIMDDNGEISGIVCIIKDITELKKAKEVLQKSQEEAISLFQNSPLPGIYHDENGVILNINQKFTELFGYSLKELKGKNINEGMIFPEGKTFLESEKLIRMCLDGKDIYHETVRKKKDGTPVPVIITVSAIIKKGEKKAIVAFYQDISKQKEYLERITESERKFRNLFLNMPAAYYQADKNGRVLMMNPTGIKLLGFQSLEEVIGKNLAQDFYYNPSERLKFIEVLKNNNGSVKDYEVSLKNKEGQPIIVSTNSQYYYDSLGEVMGVEGVFVNITERKKMEEALQESQQEFASLFESNPEATVYTDEKGNIININSRFSELFGYTLEEIKGKNIDSGLIQSSDKIREAQELTIKGLSREYLGFETIRKKKDGTLFPVYVSGSPVMIDGKQKGVIGTYYDITERKQVEKQLEELSRVDPLTGCFNRRYGLELLERQMKLSQRNQSPLLLGFLDINNFKAINDYFGHQEGDQALKEVAHLFQSTLREVDIICRMGGDEFLLVFPDNSLKESPLIRERLEEALSQLNHQIKKNYQIQFSIGFSEYLSDRSKSLDELIAMADQEMYQEKKIKKSNV
ncbi:MAG TPA: PAS domain S-box protein [Atribacterota bacterium]|nr:PAS domain S-box protein [Atribacterota bacterium]